MLSPGCERELRDSWFPHLTDGGLDRLIALLERESPLLIRGRFTSAIPQGCLATHAAWHHPATCGLAEEAGIMWLTRVAGLNPATSAVVREWDDRGEDDWQLNRDLLDALRAERDARHPSEAR